MKKILKWGLIGFGGLIVLGIIFAAIGGDSTQEKGSESDKSEKQEQVKEPKATKVDATNFITEFDKNQLAAEEKYAGKWIETTAYIDNISEDITGTPYLALQPTSDDLYFGTMIQCFFEDKSELTMLENGQQATVRGKVDTQLGNIFVKECKVLNT